MSKYYVYVADIVECDEDQEIDTDECIEISTISTTNYLVHELTTCSVTYKCEKCGYLHDAYCNEPNFIYCPGCSRRINKKGV